MENVPEPLASEEFASFSRLAQRAGYGLRADILNAADFGVPQRRRRAIVVGVLGLPSDVDVPWPMPTHANHAADISKLGQRPWVTVRKAFKGLPHEPTGENWHRARNPQPESVTRYKAVPADGGNRLQMQARLDELGLGDLVPRCWRSIRPGATTCLAGCGGIDPLRQFARSSTSPRRDGISTQRLIVPSQSARAAVLQSMESFIFPDEQSMTAVGRQIGNAVPPLLAQRIAEAVADVLPDRQGRSRYQQREPRACVA